MAEWTQQSHILANHAAPAVHGSVNAIHFDPLAELVWAGSASGQLTAHTNTPPAYPRYVSYRAHAGAPQHGSSTGVHTILSDEKGVFSVGDATVRAAARSGLGRWSVSIKCVVRAQMQVC